jgi:hypothetical protein
MTVNLIKMIVVVVAGAVLLIELTCSDWGGVDASWRDYVNLFLVI